MVADWETIVTIYYSIPIIITQLAICTLLWRQTRDGRTWGLLVTGSLLSICARYTIFFPIGIPVWVDDTLRALSISINTLGFFSLYLLLNKLLKQAKNK